MGSSITSHCYYNLNLSTIEANMFKKFVANIIVVSSLILATIIAGFMIIFPFIALTVTIVIMAIAGTAGWIYVTILGQNPIEKLNNQPQNYIDPD